ncbi:MULTISPECIES: methyltransferase domain-containing protein [unclassified Gilliamella]|uniref:methyltransferase domain-containing protein n=1 Tax=unclassified Gilliamella TaxID=2685620 RepID=UPI001327B386|nr:MULTISPECIES: methyltransferase domain-containing protein [unclassified Gilliamella]MWN31003.1 methyltransferase domain-containing protein [Gilliamella sp. Pra-s60]MWP28432.1 methyltransferase domain-containing protein [Gilliamella sp. Pra-s54]
MEIPENWSFKNKNVVDNFDSHVTEQLPWYPLATKMVEHLIRAYLPHDGVLIDFGCSTGNITKESESVLKSRNAKAISIDNSKEMANAFKGYGELVIDDMENYSLPCFDVAVCFLSIMFMKVCNRERFINSLIEKCNKGGVIIIVDKLQSFNGYLGTVISRLTLSNKILSGCTHKEIIEKELSISGVQRPIEKSDVNKFTKWLQIGEFAGFIFEK